jgi:hypothetical protein
MKWKLYNLEKGDSAPSQSCWKQRIQDLPDTGPVLVGGVAQAAEKCGFSWNYGNREAASMGVFLPGMWETLTARRQTVISPPMPSD